jgi:hypothetical protein
MGVVAENMTLREIQTAALCSSDTLLQTCAFNRP